MVESFLIGFLFFLLGSIATSCFVKMIYVMKIQKDVRSIYESTLYFGLNKPRRDE